MLTVFFIIYFGVAFSMLMIKPKEITNKKSTQKITEKNQKQEEIFMITMDICLQQLLENTIL